MVIFGWDIKNHLTQKTERLITILPKSDFNKLGLAWLIHHQKVNNHLLSLMEGTSLSEIYFERTLCEFLLENYVEMKDYLYSTCSIYMFSKLICKFYDKRYSKILNNLMRDTIRNIEKVNSNYRRVMDLVPKGKTEIIFNIAKELRDSVGE